VTEAVCGGGDELQAAKPAINFERAIAADNPTGENGDKHGDEEADDRRKENKKNRFYPAAKDEGFETCVSDCGAAISAHECVRGTRRQA